MQGSTLSRTVGMHDVTVLRITSEDVGDNLAERHREYTLVDVLYRVVYVFLRGTHATHHISVVHKKSLTVSWAAFPPFT